MNKYEKALDRLKELTVSEEHNKLYSVLQELVNKETPLPLNGYECPNGCKTFSYSERTIEVNRCDNCGQRINWNDYD